MFFCLDSTSDDPRYNLASEEFLLKNQKDDFVLFYVNRPSVIVGKHQNVFREVNRDFLKKHPVPVVRRLTGGGTVWHDYGNLNFSFILNGEAGKLVDFGKYIKPIVTFINRLGIQAATDSRNNIRIDKRKISGNAEHVYKTRVLHHGTLLFNANLPYLEEALHPNPEEISDKAVSSQQSQVTNISRHLPEPMALSLFREKLRGYCLDYFSPCQQRRFTQDENNQIEKLIREKYDTWKWNIAYSPACVLRKTIPFSGRELSVDISVKNGIIQQILFPGYAILPETFSLLARYFHGLPYRKKEAEKLSVSLWKEGKVSVISQDQWIRLLFE